MAGNLAYAKYFVNREKCVFNSQEIVFPGNPRFASSLFQPHWVQVSDLFAYCATLCDLIGTCFKQDTPAVSRYPWCPKFIFKFHSSLFSIKNNPRKLSLRPNCGRHSSLFPNYFIFARMLALNLLCPVFSFEAMLSWPDSFFRHLWPETSRPKSWERFATTRRIYL